MFIHIQFNNLEQGIFFLFLFARLKNVDVNRGDGKPAQMNERGRHPGTFREVERIKAKGKRVDAFGSKQKRKETLLQYLNFIK